MAVLSQIRHLCSNNLLRLGALMLLGVFAATWLSHSFPYGMQPADGPLVSFICTATVLGIGLALSIRWIPGQIISKEIFWGVIGVGLVMRGAMFMSLPVLEDDSYRYLWDGAVVAHGINPYTYAPADAGSYASFDDLDPAIEGPELEKLKVLAKQNPEVPARINYPFVKTIYPPFAQAGFVLAHHLDPFGLTGWRLVLLFSDLVSVVLLAQLLTSFGRSCLWIVLYWWNPVVILQGFGAGHMDVLVVPFLLGALLLHRMNRSFASVTALAGAAAVKLWPVLLFPVLARNLLKTPAKLVIVTAFFVAVTGILLLPQLLTMLAPDSGVHAYSTSWHRHAFLFSILEGGLSIGIENSDQAARLVVAVIVSITSVVLAYIKGNERQTIPVAMAFTVAALILFSPTGYPWYLIWLSPFLVFVPNAGLLALFATAPLYYSRFLLGDDNLFYDWGILPVAFGIPILMILADLRQKGSI